MSFGWSATDIAALLKLAKQTYDRFKDAPEQFKAFESEATGLWTVLCNMDHVLSEHRGLTEWQRQALGFNLTECRELLTILDEEIYKNHLLGSKDVHGLLDRSGRFWRRLTWDQKKIMEFRSRVTLNVSLLNAVNASLPSKVAVETKAGVDQLHARQDERERVEGKQAILDWLDVTDYGLQQSDFLSRRQEGTGEWLPNSADFQRWLQIKGETLFCSGIPGAGKTILTAVVIDDLTTRFSANQDVGIAYVYCNFQLQQKQNAISLLTSLLKQLFRRQSSSSDSVEALYKKHHPNGTRPLINEVSAALQSVLDQYSRVFIIVDALDECLASGEYRGKLLSHLLAMQEKSNVNLFVTSRHVAEITTKFHRSIRMEIEASEQDIQRYIAGHVSMLPEWVQLNSGLVKEIKTEITKAVQGMFLLAQLHLDSLCEKGTVKDIRTTLRKLPTGSGVYDSAYDNAMERIDHQVKERKDLAYRVLSWIVYAMRPLTVDELTHALAVEIGETKLDLDNICSRVHLLSVCAGLVTVDKGSDIIRLVHYTTQVYFEQNQNTLFPNAKDDLTRTCIAYLSFGAFENGRCSEESEFEERLETYKLYDYASKNWGHHARISSPHHADLVLNFLGIGRGSTGRRNFEASVQAFIGNSTKYSEAISPRRFPTIPGCLDVAAHFGLLNAVKTLLDMGGSDVNVDYLGTSVSWAAIEGHTEVVQLLLDLDANKYAESQQGLTPLCCAAKNDRENIVRLLLDKEACPDRKDINDRTPLQCAIMNDNEYIVKLLLDKQADCEAQNLEGGTPLGCAVLFASVTIVNLLLDHGADPNLPTWSLSTAMNSSIRRSEHDIVKTIIGRGADLEVADSYGQTPLLVAIRCREESIVKLLINSGADITVKDVHGLTSLLLAIHYGTEGIIKLLLERGANLGMQTSDGWAALLYAAVCGREDIVALILDEEANLEVWDTNDYTPLANAALPRREDVVKLLLERGADPNARYPLEVPPKYLLDTIGSSALAMQQSEYGAGLEAENVPSLLSSAVRLGDESLVRLLLEYGACLEVQNEATGETALIEAVCQGRESIVELLIAEGANLEATDAVLRGTPLWWAASGGKLAVVKLLRYHGADIDPSNANGQTPLLDTVLNETTEAMAKLLLELGADVGARNLRGRTTVSLAASVGSEPILRILLDYSADIENGALIDLPDINGRTPLSLAAEEGHEAAVRLLLERGAAINAQDYSWKCPLHWACLSGQPVIESLLREKGATIPEDFFGFQRLFEIPEEEDKYMTSLTF